MKTRQRLGLVFIIIACFGFLDYRILGGDIFSALFFMLVQLIGITLFVIK